jgi:hypothetical protein
MEQIWQAITDAAASSYLYFRLGSKIQTSEQVLHMNLASLCYENIPSKHQSKYDHFDSKENSNVHDEKHACNRKPGLIQTMSWKQLPQLSSKFFRVCVVSDTHERHDCITASIPPCDLLIHSGDIMMLNRHFSLESCLQKVEEFNVWLGKLPAKQKVIIAGNHDKIFEVLGEESVQKMLTNAIYLCNSSITIAGYKIFGTPYSRGKSGNRAFQSKDFGKLTQDKIHECLKDGPIDIFISHSKAIQLGTHARQTLSAHVWGHDHASYGIQCMNKSEGKPYHDDKYDMFSQNIEQSKSALEQKESESKSKNEESSNKSEYTNYSLSKSVIDGIYLNICASIMNSQYCPTNSPIVVDFNNRISSNLE